MANDAQPETKPPLSSVILRRVAVAVGLMLLMLIPSAALLVATGQPSATYAAMGVLVGAIAVLAGGIQIGIITSIVLALIAPIAIVAGLSPLTGAALMALMTLMIGRLSRFGLHKATMLVPIMIAWPMLAPIPWLPREAIDKLNSLLADHSMTLAQALDSLHPGQSTPTSSESPMSRIVGHALMEQRFDTTYLAWIALFFFVGSIIPVIVLPLLTRKMNRPEPVQHTHSEAVSYTITITVLTAAATYYFLDHPKLAGGSFLIATILVLTQVGSDIQWRLTIERVVGTLAGVVFFIAVATVFGGTTFVEVVGLPMPMGLYGIGLLCGALAIIAKFGRRQWPYYVLMAPTTACLNAFTTTDATSLGEQRLVDNLAGAALVILAALITLAASRLGTRRQVAGIQPS